MAGETSVIDSLELEPEANVDATVLVVDDEPNIVTLLETWLETIGCKVVSAGDGEKGVAKATEILPDLILMDGMMPRMSGFDACKALKSQEATKDIPLIFLTVQGEVQDVVKGLEFGAHGYMTKPFKPQELLARVRSTLKIKQIQDRLKSHTQTLRKRWDWIHGALDQLPVGLLVFDAETLEGLFSNDRWNRQVGPVGEGKVSAIVEFLKEGVEANEVLASSEDVEGTFEVKIRGVSKGDFALKASSFEKSGKTGRQVLLL